MTTSRTSRLSSTTKTTMFRLGWPSSEWRKWILFGRELRTQKQRDYYGQGSLQAKVLPFKFRFPALGSSEATENFQWTKALLSTKIPQLLQNDKGSIQFSIPSSCPESNIACLTALDDDNQPLEKGKQAEEAVGSSISPSSKKRANRKSLALVETEVRRSRRLKSANKGFKTKGCTFSLMKYRQMRVLQKN